MIAVLILAAFLLAAYALTCITAAYDDLHRVLNDDDTTTDRT